LGGRDDVAARIAVSRIVEHFLVELARQGGHVKGAVVSGGATAATGGGEEGISKRRSGGSS
jgi:hypothetical protein